MIPAPDGYQYGVRYTDGSVEAGWNGHTQRKRAEEWVAYLNATYAPDRFVVVRRGLSEETWQEVVD